MILGLCTFRKLQRFEFHEELWLPWQPKEKTLKKSSCPKLQGLELSYLAALYQNTSNYGPRLEISPYVVGFRISHRDKEGII